MTISNKTRKILWGKSGNRCAICRRELILDANYKDGSSIIGEECHIIAREQNGPRGNSELSAEQRDEYDNLLLLCRVHHKQLDDQPSTYDTTLLKTIRSLHETWVQQSLTPKTSPSASQPFIIFRIDSGKQFVGLLSQVEATRFDNDELNVNDDIELIADFFQKVRDYIDICNELEPRDKILLQREFDEEIGSLQSNGFLIYASVTAEMFGNKSKPISLCVVNMVAFRITNPTVARKDENLESVMMKIEQHTSQYTNFVLVRPS